VAGCRCSESIAQWRYTIYQWEYVTEHRIAATSIAEIKDVAEVFDICENLSISSHDTANKEREG
jgi:hypothetical protein